MIGSISLPPLGDDETLDSVRTALSNSQTAEHVVVIVDNEHQQRAKKVNFHEHIVF